MIPWQKMIKEPHVKIQKVLCLIQQSRKSSVRAVVTCLLGVLVFHNAASDQAIYVSDEFSIPLRAGPDVNERIIRTKITSGTKLQKLDGPLENNYIKVQTSQGEIGWLPAEFVVTEPPSKLLLDEQKEYVKTLSSELNTAREKADSLENRAIEINDANQELKTRIATLEAELLNIKVLASDTVKINQDNTILKDTNQRLRDSLLQLTEREKTLSKTSRYLDFLIGAGLIGAGLVIGLILKGRRKSTGWTN